MNFHELIREVGGNVDIKDARVQSVERMSTGGNVWIAVRILNPSTVSVNRIDTWLAKLDEASEVKCILKPDSFLIIRNPTFSPREAEIFPKREGDLVEAILAEIKVGDVLKVLHIDPPKHPGKYVDVAT